MAVLAFYIRCWRYFRLFRPRRGPCRLLHLMSQGTEFRLLCCRFHSVVCCAPTHENFIGMTASGPVGPAELMAKLNNQFQSRGDTSYAHFTMATVC